MADPGDHGCHNDQCADQRRKCPMSVFEDSSRIRRRYELAVTQRPVRAAETGARDAHDPAHYDQKVEPYCGGD